MTDQIIITGVEQLSALGRRLKVAGEVGLRRELLAGLRASTGPMIKDAKQAARDKLPKAGGLNEKVANDPILVRNRLGGRDVGVRIVTTKTEGRGANRGQIRHPVYGHSDRWVTQTYEPAKNWFDDSMRKSAPAAVTGILAAMEVTALKITKG